MDELVLLLEVGANALSDLTDGEKALILAQFTNAQVKQAGLTVFELLSKNFEATYRMGSLYEASSEKYKHYHSIYLQYLRETSAGKTSTLTTVESDRIERNKFLTND